MKSVDLAILVAYLVGVTVFGCSFYFRKNAKGAAGFVVGGGHVPSWAIGLSIFATEILGTGHAPMMPAFAALRFGKPEGEADGGPPLLKLRRTGVVQTMSGEAPR